MTLRADDSQPNVQKDQKTSYRAALKMHKSVIQDLKKAKLENKMVFALDAVIRTAVAVLKKKNHTAQAAYYLDEWETVYSPALHSIHLLDLGDHAYLSEWLDHFYMDLVNTLGLKVVHFFHLDDINVFNYAIPVVFQPNGDQKSGDSWDREEYRRHFVPFAAATSYWSSNVACNIATFGSGFVTGLICIPITEIFRWTTEKWFAPSISNHVYDLFNKSNSWSSDDLDLSKQEMQESSYLLSIE